MKISNCIPLCALMLFLVSCADGPEDVAEEFVEATNKGEYKEAQQYADEPTSKMLGMIDQFIPELKKKELSAQDVDVTVLSSEVKDSIATVKVDLKINDKDNGIKTIKLIKKDKEWKVTGGKESNGATHIPMAKPPEHMGKG